MKFLYVAGPMSGHPRHNREAFIAARSALNATGKYYAYTPTYNAERVAAKLTGGPMDWDDPEFFTEEMRHRAMRYNFATLAGCDGIALLEGWESSAGVRAELAAAEAMGIRAAPVEAWLREAA